MFLLKYKIQINMNISVELNKRSMIKGKKKIEKERFSKDKPLLWSLKLSWIVRDSWAIIQALKYWHITCKGLCCRLAKTRILIYMKVKMAGQSIGFGLNIIVKYVWIEYFKLMCILLYFTWLVFMCKLVLYYSQKKLLMFWKVV